MSNLGGSLSSPFDSYQTLFASTNNSGLRWSNTNLPAGITNSPNVNVITLTNTSNYRVNVQCYLDFGSSYIWYADSNIRVRFSYVILRNGVAIETGTDVQYVFVDSTPLNNPQQQIIMRTNGSTSNRTNIIAAPADTIGVRQSSTVEVLTGGAGNERYYLYGGISKIVMYPDITAII